MKEVHEQKNLLHHATEVAGGIGGLEGEVGLVALRIQ